MRSDRDLREDGVTDASLFDHSRLRVCRKNARHYGRARGRSRIQGRKQTMAGKRSTEDKYALAGIFVGMAIAAVATILFASQSCTLVRYLIMASGLLIGWFVGRSIGRRKS